MSFRHAPVHCNPRLIGSYCLLCGRCVAVSTHEAMLVFSEKHHTCQIMTPGEQRAQARQENKAV